MLFDIESLEKHAEMQIKSISRKAMSIQYEVLFLFERTNPKSTSRISD